MPASIRLRAQRLAGAIIPATISSGHPSRSLNPGNAVKLFETFVYATGTPKTLVPSPAGWIDTASGFAWLRGILFAI